MIAVMLIGVLLLFRFLQDPLPPIPGLDAGQMLIVGFVSMLIGQAVILVMAKFQDKKQGKTVCTIVIFVVSVIAAGVLTGLKISINSDSPADIANLVLQQASVILGLATLLYNTFVSKLADKWGLSQERVLGVK